MRLTKRQLQAKLDALTSAVNRAHAARAAIYEHCESVYGTNPGEVDNDTFIDACDGGGGSASGMTAEDFDKSMRLAMNMSGIKPPPCGDCNG